MAPLCQARGFGAGRKGRLLGREACRRDQHSPGADASARPRTEPHRQVRPRRVCRAWADRSLVACRVTGRRRGCRGSRATAATRCSEPDRRYGRFGVGAGRRRRSAASDSGVLLCGSCLRRACDGRRRRPGPPTHRSRQAAMYLSQGSLDTKPTSAHTSDVFRRSVAISLALMFVLGAGVLAAGEDRIFPVSNANCQEANTISNSSVCLPDSNGHTVYVNALGTNLKAATQWTLSNSYNTVSPIVIITVSAPITSGTGETDVYYRTRNDLPNGIFAYAGCNDNSIGNSRCDQFYVTYHGDFLCSQSAWCTSTSVHRSLACHETGHTFGLMHPDSSSPQRPTNQADYYCMRNDAPAFASTILGTQNVQALQSVQYPSGSQ